MGSSSGSKSSQARLREALTAGNPTAAKGPPVADGVLSVTPDTAEAIEWKSRKSVVDTIASCSTFLDDDDEGPPTCELYGKFTWQLDKFGESGKRELRSNVFEVGSFKWYLLVYPQGCDVANHLSLFLCVADYDKLLPGWSHFAQFTISVVNADPKKSKYSDTLHRFCKKEHDWGWKKFMELSKVLDGFTLDDSLVIKAQVQVIRDRPQRPFRCLDGQYRRELARVYLANVEGLARRFVDEKREQLQRLLEDGRGLRAFWDRLEPAARRELTTEPAPAIFKGVVKRFFNEKEVTSTLVMDALYCGCKLLEDAGRRCLQSEEASEACGSDSSSGGTALANGVGADGRLGEPAGVLIDARRGAFFFAGDAISVLERAAADAIPPWQSDKQQGELPLRMAQEADECCRDAVERDERRLADLGRRCVELYAATHIASTRIEAAFQEAETIKRQEALLAEEELLEAAEEARQAARAEADRERRAKKKERQKKKKEAERAKREAEEAERQEQEAARRQEQLKRQAEAEERRRREEAEREAERERQRAARQAADAKRRARQQQEAAAAAVARQQQQPQQQDGPAGSRSSSVSGCDDASSALAASLSSAASDASGQHGGSSSALSSRATPELEAAGAGGDGSATPAASSRLTEESSLLSAASGPASELSGEEEGDGEAATLRRQLAAAEGQLVAREAQLAALQARVAELEGKLASASGSSCGDPLPPSSSACVLEATAANGVGGHAGMAAAPAARAASLPASSLPPAAPPAPRRPSSAAGQLAPQRPPSARQPQQHGSPALVARSGSGGSASSASSAAAASRAAASLPAMNPAAQQFNPAASNGGSSSGDFGGGPGPKRAGYAAAAAGEPVGPPPGAANGASYRSAVVGASLPPSLPSLGLSGSRSSGATSAATQPSAPSDESSSHNSIDGLANAGLQLPNGTGGGGDGLYGRLPAVVLPSGLAAGKAAAAALESPGFDDFAHMGLISDLLE